MTTLQLEYLIDIGETRSISLTAKRYFISQPAVSKQISLLERELGFELLDRNHKPLRFTTAGEALLASLRRCREDFRRTCRQFRTASENRILLGCIPCLDIGDSLLNFITELKRTDPAAELFAETLTQNARRASEYDMFVTFANIPSEGDTADIPLFEARNYIVFSHADPIISKPNLSPSDFADKPFFTIGAQCQSCRNHVEMCRSFGFEPNIRHTRDTTSLVMALVAENGFTIMHELCREVSMTSLARLPLPSGEKIVLRLRSGASEFVRHTASELAETLCLGFARRFRTSA